MLQSLSLTKRYPSAAGDVEVLRGVDLEVPADGMTAVMGPSGSGKSTLLYCLAGLEPPSGGEVHYRGEDLHRRSRSELARMRRGEFGFVFQASNLLPFLTVAQNVALPFRLARERVPDARIAETLRRFGLDHRTDALPANLSGGEQQRVAIARAAVASPTIVFADEPTAALDLNASHVVVDALEELAGASDRAVLVATHDPMVAARCATVVFLVDGLVVGTLHDPSVDRIVQRMTELRTSAPEPPCG